MRKFIRNIYLSAAGKWVKPSKSIHILNSHYISRNNYTPSEVFYDQLKILSKNCTFIDIQDAVNLVIKKEVPKEPLVAFTYDDGFEECYTKIAPVLDSFNIKAGFFINPGFIEADKEYKENFLQNAVHVNEKNPMNWKQVVSLHENGHAIGSHTLDHYNLNSHDERELIHQIAESKKIIENKISEPCNYFAFPYGMLQHINSESLVIASEYHQVIFSGTNYINYFSMNGQIINRRHCEPDWPVNHVKYFLSKIKTY